MLRSLLHYTVLHGICLHCLRAAGSLTLLCSCNNALPCHCDGNFEGPTLQAVAAYKASWIHSTVQLQRCLL